MGTNMTGALTICAGQADVDQKGAKEYKVHSGEFA